MEIYPFDKTFEDNFTIDDVSAIQAEGMSIRIGNKVVKLQVTEETVIDDTDSVRKEMEEGFSTAVENMKQQFEKYKEQMKHALSREKDKIARKEQELSRRINEVSSLPNLTTTHLSAGLSVAKNGSNGLLWSYKTVYAPKFVNDQRIDPTFAKRLVTPICINIFTDNRGMVVRCRVRQILGDRQFYHYHSLSNDDCWGNFKPNGRTITEPDEMITLCKEAAIVLETINDLSIGTMNPRGLPRYNTLKKHLLSKEESGNNPNNSRSAANSRNERSGVSETMETTMTEDVWTT